MLVCDNVFDLGLWLCVDVGDKEKVKDGDGDCECVAVSDQECERVSPLREWEL
jgi:hypothetical protein